MSPIVREEVRADLEKAVEHLVKLRGACSDTYCDLKELLKKYGADELGRGRLGSKQWRSVRRIAREIDAFCLRIESFEIPAK